MSDLAAMSDRHEALLSELGRLGMAMARDLQARAAAATDADEAAEMALAFHRISRSLRQTIALEAKLARGRLAPDMRAAELAARHERVRRRHAEVTRAVETLVWTEYEGDEAENLLDDLREILGDAIQEEDFADLSVETHVARLYADLGLDLPAAAASLDDEDEPPGAEAAAAGPPPPAAAPSSDDDGSPRPLEAVPGPWRSSA